MSKISFFMPMVPPEVTAQEHKVTVDKKTGKIRFYDPPELKAAKLQLMDSIARNMPDDMLKFTGPVRLVTKWIWPEDSRHPHGYKATRPDTDNLIKMFKDCMTSLGFWDDDAQVASEITEKFYGSVVGIYVEILDLS